MPVAVAEPSSDPAVDPAKALAAARRTPNWASADAKAAALDGVSLQRIGFSTPAATGKTDAIAAAGLGH